MNGHLYAAYGVVNGRDVCLKKKYTSRNAAIDGMFDYFDKNLYVDNMQVQEEIIKEKHVIEYVCNNNTRFTVARV